jgi:hypothetical protein
VLDGIADDVSVESLKRLWTQLGKVTWEGSALGRRVVEAEQTEGPVRRRIGQMTALPP